MRKPRQGPYRRPQLLKQPAGSQRRVSQTAALPSPVGGWNVRDSIANMEPTDALTLDNWFPETGYVRIRRGYDDHVTGITGQVESLMPYNEADGTETLFCAADDSFYDVTSGGAVGAAVVSGLSNARWQHVNFTNTSGDAYLLNFNGVDEPQYWDGSTWTSINSGSTTAITGVTSSTLDNPWIHKRRLWVTQTNTLSAWYFPVDAVGGSATEFRLDGLFKKGGFLVAGGTWTVDAGEGLDDYQVFVTSEGQVAVYRGTDPSSASTWSIQGVWSLGEPIGKRCLMKYAGDLLIIMKDGVFPLSAALKSSQVDPRASITNKIQGAMSESAQLYGSNFGWQLIHYPSADMIILNVPVETGTGQVQYAMNTITGAWCRFTSIEANCWAVSNQRLFFGGNNVVGEFWHIDNDNGDDIQSDLQQAFNPFGDRGSLKHWRMVKPHFSSNGSPEITATLNVDYDQSDTLQPLTTGAVDYAAWDSAIWDTSLWGASLIQIDEWVTVTNYGTTAGLRLKALTKDIEVRFQAADYVFEPGGVI